MKFKIGDKVYSKYNPMWGMSVMTVVQLYEDGSVTCKNPDFSSYGNFDADCLEKCSKERTIKLKKLKKMETECRNYRDKLFN